MAHRLCAVFPLAHHLLTQAYHNAWANRRLLDACMTLSRAEFAAPLRVADFTALGFSEAVVWPRAE